jgi:hypothetical protein
LGDVSGHGEELGMEIAYQREESILWFCVFHMKKAWEHDNGEEARSRLRIMH